MCVRVYALTCSQVSNPLRSPSVSHFVCFVCFCKKICSCSAGSREGCREYAQPTIWWALKALSSFLSWWIFLPFKGQHATLFFPLSGFFQIWIFFLPRVSSFSYFTIIKSRFLLTHAVALFFFTLWKKLHFFIHLFYCHSQNEICFFSVYFDLSVLMCYFRKKQVAIFCARYV